MTAFAGSSTVLKLVEVGRPGCSSTVDGPGQSRTSRTPARPPGRDSDMKYRPNAVASATYSRPWRHSHQSHEMPYAPAASAKSFRRTVGECTAPPPAAR